MNRRNAIAHLTALAGLGWMPRLADASPGPRAIVDVDRNMILGTITVRAFIDVYVDPRLAWAVLTDYNHLAEFVPDMQYSKMISKPGEPPRVLQSGKKSWLMLDAPFEVLMQMDETPGSRIGFRQLSGTLQDMYGEWRLLPFRGGVRIGYYARMEPGLLSPRMPGDSLLIESDIGLMVEAIAKEAVRRQNLRSRQRP
jgi:polyketide cyclase/dehydrase/lipid transport protein